MKVKMEWTLAPKSLTLDELAARDPPYHFLYNGIIYAGIIRLELIPESKGPCYVVVALGASTPRRLLGSTVVTPVTPSPPILF
jgi:hypothetical protein